MNTLTHVDAPAVYDVVHVRPGQLVYFDQLGIQVRANFNDPEYASQPYVTVNADDLPAAHLYDDGSGTPEHPAECPKIAVHLGENTLYDDEGAGPRQTSDMPKTDRYEAMENALAVILTAVNDPSAQMGDVHRVVCDQLTELGMVMT